MQDFKKCTVGRISNSKKTTRDLLLQYVLKFKAYIYILEY